jgi:formylglycine-generating enzyme required for sulfatase activity
MEEAKAGVSLVFLDACRDNPFGRRFRSASRGLAKVEAASGTLIHYATRPGSVASDGEGRNGTYTEALLALMSEPGIPVELMLKRVANNVVAKTKGKQEPWVEGSLRGDFYFRTVTGATSGAAPQLTTPVDLTAVEISFWESIKGSTDAEDFQAYLDKYPGGQFVALAERRVKKKPTKVDQLTTNAEASAVAGAIIKDCADCPEMVILPAGSFEMGSNSGEDNEKPIHRVTLKAFAIGKTEVTQGQWRAVMGKNLSRFSNCGDSCPAELVNWNHAKEFVQKLSTKTGKTYRLPTEAEWEYACRAGGDHSYCGSENIDSVARYEGNSGGTTRPVAGKQANAWGVYDMSGNVWEWTEDCWNGSYNGAPSDGSAWTSGECEWHVMRGGSYDHVPQYARSTFRSGTSSVVGRQDLGFRVARMLDQSPAAKPDPPKIEAATDGQEWADSDNGSDINWNEATQYCASKGSGWRLPTVAELQASYRSGQSTPCGSYQCKVASKSRLTGPAFWTNERDDSTEAWAVSLYVGKRGRSSVEDRTLKRALCVRPL